MNEPEKRRPRSRKKEENIFMRPYQPPRYDPFQKIKYKKKINNTYFNVLCIIWFSLSIGLGLIADSLFIPITPVKNFFIPYDYHITQFNKFCHVMTFIFILMPFAVMLISKNVFEYVFLTIKDKIINTLLFLLFLLLFISDEDFFLSPLSFATAEGKPRIIYDIIIVFDWFGAASVLFCVLTCESTIISLFIKNGKE